MELLFTNAVILPVADDMPRCMRGAVGIAGNRIALVTDDGKAVEAFRAAHPRCREIDCTGRLVMPGLVNTHCHIAMTLQRSQADDIALMAWLNDHIWPFEARQTPEEIVVGMKLGLAELLLGGVTSVVDMYFHQERCIEPVARAGIRAVLGFNIFDRDVETVIAQAGEAVRLAAPCDRIRIALGPHAPYTVSPENLRRSLDAGRRLGIPQMIHVAETRDEVQLVAERYGASPVAHLDALGMFDERTIAAHCIHLSDEDIAILARRGVTVAHNPQSNMKLSSGAAPVERLRAAGVTVTLATDGASSNNDLDMWEEMRTASLLQKYVTGSPQALPAGEVLRMATANGARAMGHAPGTLGVLREGALADLIVVDMQRPHWQPLHDPVATAVYCGKAADVVTVVVDGRIVVEERRFAPETGIDLPALYAEAAEAVARIKRRRG